MAVDERARHELHERLADALGPEHAGTLMSYLPPVGWADVATKQDLAAVRTDIEALRIATKQDLAALENRFESTLQRELMALQRTMLFGMFTIVLTVAVLAFGAAQVGG